MPESVGRRWVAVLLAGLCAGLPALAQDGRRPDAGARWMAQVTYVVDGDSVWVRGEVDGQRRRVRLDGIDAPEICQDSGREARAALQAMVLKRRVRVIGRAYDDYGRLIATLEQDGQDVAQRLVAGGWAWGHRYEHYPVTYGAEEAAARQARRGLFAQATPELPADFRRRHGPCTRPTR
jgi:micrococcal nuclease